MREARAKAAAQILRDEGLPESLIRVGKPSKKPTATAPESESTTEPQAETLTSSDVIEADRRWREWLPTATQRKRPRKSSFLKQVRRERNPATTPNKEYIVRNKTKKASRSKARGNTNGKSKVDLIAGLLKRNSGCTAKDVLEATGWPSVSMPAQAKAAGLKLKKEKKKGESTRYFGHAAAA
jgi:Protein of unknown function (DUF3489)